MNFNWKEFEKENIAVHCKTEEESLDFLNKCRERGYQIYVNSYNEYKENTCYTCYYNCYDMVCDRVKIQCKHEIFCSSKDWCEKKYCKIIDWKIKEQKPYKAWELEEGKVYKILKGNTLFRITKEGRLEQYNKNFNSWNYNTYQYNVVSNYVFYEIEREIDWDKVPRGTKVQVRNNEEDEWINRYFIRYNPFEEEYPFLTSENVDNVFTGFKMENSSFFSKHCKIHPSVEIPNEWYKG